MKIFVIVLGGGLILLLATSFTNAQNQEALEIPTESSSSSVEFLKSYKDLGSDSKKDLERIEILENKVQMLEKVIFNK